MAIQYLNTVDLNQNQLNQAVIQNVGTDPATGVVGQIIFNTSADTLKQYVADTQNPPVPATPTPGWIEVGATSAVESIDTTNGTFINLTPTTRTTGNVVITADLSATGTAGNTTFLRGDNSWAVVDNYVSWTLTGDSGTPESVSSGETVDIAGGLKITTDIAANRTLNIVHDLQTQTDTTSTSSPSYGGTFTTVDTVTRDTTGHVTGINVKTITLPSTDDTTYDLTSKANVSSGADIDLTDNDGNVDTVTLIGTAGEIEVAQSATAGTIVISQPSDVTIGNDLQVDNDATVDGSLTVAGTGNFTGEVTVPTATAGTSAPNLAQVELLVAGVGVFQGGYNASTDPGVPVISGASNIALDQGDYYVVTNDGDITFSDTTVSVEVGDFIFASAAITANSDPASTEYTFVIADANIAGAGATDGATEKGVAGFDSASFTVSSTGWVQLKPQSNPYGAKVTLDDGGSATPATSPCTRSESGGLTTFTIDLTDASLFGTSALASNVKAEITQIAAPYETVYVDVARSGSGTISFAFTGSVASDVYAALLVYV
jgi:hypothetical protein